MICDACKQEISYDQETVNYHLDQKCLEQSAYNMFGIGDGAVGTMTLVRCTICHQFKPVNLLWPVIMCKDCARLTIVTS